MKAVRERGNWWPNKVPTEELTNSQRVEECGRIPTDREMMHTVDNYATTESDKIRVITRLLLSSSKNKSLDLTIIGNINTPITSISDWLLSEEAFPMTLSVANFGDI